MLIVKGKSEKSKWLSENFINNKTLIFDSEQLTFPPLFGEYTIHTVTDEKVLDEFVKEYLIDEDIRSSFNNIVLYNISNVENAKRIEASIKHYHADFKLAITIQGDNEVLEINKM